MMLLNFQSQYLKKQGKTVRPVKSYHPQHKQKTFSTQLLRSLRIQTQSTNN
jgi:hypothetical protein